MTLDRNVGNFLNKLGGNIKMDMISEEKSSNEKHSKEGDSVEEIVRRVVREELENILEDKYLLDEASVNVLKQMIAKLSALTKNVK